MQRCSLNMNKIVQILCVGLLAAPLLSQGIVILIFSVFGFD